MNKKYILLLAAASLLASLAVAVPALAQTQVSAGVSARVGFHGGPGPAMIPGVFGTVTAINGTSLTVTSNNRVFMHPGGMASSTTVVTTTVYTVDASNAKIYKNSTTTTSIASIATGDTVVVQGAITGTNVVATTIRDGVVPGMMGKPGMFGGRGFGGNSTSTRASSTWASSTPPFTGNGEPVIAGKITVISGTTITVTNASNVTYTIDASSATIVKNGTSTAIGNLATGDNLVVQGVVNGTSITASSVIDQGTGVKGGNASSTTGSHSAAPIIGGFIGAIGGFFKHLFGF